MIQFSSFSCTQVENHWDRILKISHKAYRSGAGAKCLAKPQGTNKCHLQKHQAFFCSLKRYPTKGTLQKVSYKRYLTKGTLQKVPYKRYPTKGTLQKAPYPLSKMCYSVIRVYLLFERKANFTFNVKYFLNRPSV